MIQAVLGAAAAAAVGAKAEGIAEVAAGAEASLQKQNLLVAQNLVQSLRLLVLDPKASLQNLALYQDLVQDPDLLYHLVRRLLVKAPKNAVQAKAGVRAEAGAVAGARVYLYQGDNLAGFDDLWITKDVKGHE